MQYLLGETRRADEADDLAHQMVRFHALFGEMRWHGRAASLRRVDHLERLTQRDPTRGAMVNFMHHGYYYGVAASIARHGIKVTAPIAPSFIAPDAPPHLRQHAKVASMNGVEMVSALGSADHLANVLQTGTVVAIATDVPGRSEVDFLGRRRLCASGAARLASSTDSLVFIVTSHCEDGEVYFDVEAPLDPRDHADAQDLLQAIVTRHEPAVLAWPEAVDSPLDRWGQPEPFEG